MSSRGSGKKSREKVEMKKKVEKPAKDIEIEKELGEIEEKGKGDKIRVLHQIDKQKPLDIKFGGGDEPDGNDGGGELRSRGAAGNTVAGEAMMNGGGIGIGGSGIHGGETAVGASGGRIGGAGESRVHFGVPMSDRVYYSHWDLLNPAARIGALWYWDNVKIRIQRAFVNRYLPTRSIWKKKRIKAEVELLFEDIDEEIYFEGQFVKGVEQTESERRKAEEMSRKELEDWEEELTGYDKFTVEEEKKIKKMFEERFKELKRLQREERIT